MEHQVEDGACKNEACSSYGEAHPNCLCYSGMAKGGMAVSFCSKTRPHQKGCKYLSKGGFALDSETETHYTVKHPKGDVLRIAKKGLSPAIHASIKKMARGGVANYAEGTGPEGAQFSDAEVPPGSMSEAQPSQPPVTINIHNGGAKGEQNQTPMEPAKFQESEMPNGAGGAGGNPQQVIPGANYGAVPNYPQQLQGAIDQTTLGAKQQAAAKGALGNQEADIYAQNIFDQNRYNSLIEKNFGEEQKHLKNVADDYATNKIDYNRVWHNKNAGQKVLAGIGMLLSGMGSGVAHQPNMALQMINDEIERDIKSQMNEQEKKKTAYSMYKDYYGNADHAYQAQKLATQAIVAAKINEATSKNAGPMAEAQKNLVLGQVLQPMQKQLYDLALQRANYQFMMGAGGPSGNQLTSGQHQTNANAVEPSQAADQELQSTMPQLGRTGAVNLQKLNGLQALGWIPKEDKEAASKEAKEFQESQTTKSLLLKDVMDMANSVTENRGKGMLTDPLSWRHAQERIAKLPFEIGKSISEGEPWGGPIGRKFATAKSSALNKINTLLTKRIGGEAMKNIDLQLPDRIDNNEEIKGKIERIMTLIDSNTATPTLDRYGLIKR